VSSLHFGEPATAVCTKTIQAFIRPTATRTSLHLAEVVPIIETGVSGGAGEPPPCVPTEPYLKVSLHTALVVEPFNSGNPSSNVQIALIGNDVFGTPNHRLLPGSPALVCACGQSIWQGVDPPVATLDTVLNGRSDRSRSPNHAPLD